jgi:hypothetical protein
MRKYFPLILLIYFVFISTLLLLLIKIELILFRVSWRASGIIVQCPTSNETPQNLYTSDMRACHFLMILMTCSRNSLWHNFANRISKCVAELYLYFFVY